MAVHYRLKAIDFLGRDVPVVVQNENGPCPLIALANVLLLRNQIQLSVDYSEVSQERLLALIAGFLLDSNNPERLGTSDGELQANLQKNMGDAVEMLPKLTTGLDVNIFYHDIKGFEFTDVVAIFDLLDIHLVHGWMVDPQDKETVACIGNMSYNALIERLLSLAGSASADTSAAAAADTITAPGATSIGAPDNATQPPEYYSPGSSSAAEAPPAADSAAEPAPMDASATAEKSPADKNMQQELDLLGSEYDSDLQAALNLSLSQPAPETSSKPEDMQQPQPMAIDEPPQPTVALVAAPQPALADAGAEVGNAAADGAALAEDYVVISHPKRMVLDEEMAEPSTAQETPKAATEPAQEPPHKSDPAAEERTPEAAADPSKELPQNCDPAPEEVDAESQATDSTGAVQAQEVVDSDSRVVGASTIDKAPGAAHLAAMLAGCSKEAFPAAPTEASGAAALQVTAGSVAGDADGDASMVPEQAPAAGDLAPPPGGPAAPGDAHVIRAFLDNTSSQLTEHGLISLHAGLKPNQLAVLFRNNHFNTLFKYEDALYILVTDLGYLHERQVVWEKLDAIDGDTVFVNSTLKSEPAKARTPEEARTSTEQANADYALALQLHQEEQEAAERRRAAAAADGRAGDGQPPPAQTRQLGPPAPSQQDTGGWGRAGHRHHGRHNRPGSGSRHNRPKQEACNIM